MTQPMRQKTLDWSRQKGLNMLALSLLASIAAALLFALWALLGDTVALFAAIGSLLSALATLLLLAALAALGTWVAPLSQRTWQERLQLRALELEHNGLSTDRIVTLRALADDQHAACTILEQGRLYFWIGMFVAPPALILSLQSSSVFGTLGDPLAFAAILTAPVAAVGLASLLRGSQLLRDGRRLLRTIDPAPPKHRAPRRTRPTLPAATTDEA